MKIRSYIHNWIESTNNLIKADNTKILCQAPTGSGKTVFAGVLISQLKSKRILFIAPRRKLVLQTQEKFNQIGLKNTTLIMGGQPYDKKAKICIGTIDSVVLKDYGEFDYIIVDEIHNGYTGERMSFLFSKHESAICIGLSATPIDQYGYLLEGFDAVIDSVDIQKMQELGWSAKDIYEVPMTPDFSKCRISNVSNEYNIDDITDVMDMEEITKSAFDNWTANASDRKTMIFCTGIDHAVHVKEYFEKQGQPVQIVHSKMKEKEIITNFELFENSGKILINVDMATFGFDDEFVSCEILLRPIHSLRLYIQIVGRGLRKSDGKKDCLIQDYGGNFERHGNASDKRKYEFKEIFGKIVDKQLHLDDEENRKQILNIPVQKRIVLKRVGRLLDLYWDKEYPKEAELLEDTRKLLKHSEYFSWRQNSGSKDMSNYNEPPRWVHFTDIKGLPDISLFAKDTSFYVGVELKSAKGVLNENQKKTLPRMKRAGLLVYLARDIRELWAILIHLKKNIKFTEDGILIKNSINNLWESQYKLQKKLKLIK